LIFAAGKSGSRLASGRRSWMIGTGDGRSAVVERIAVQATALCEMLLPGNRSSDNHRFRQEVLPATMQNSYFI